MAALTDVTRSPQAATATTTTTTTNKTTGKGSKSSSSSSSSAPIVEKTHDTGVSTVGSTQTQPSQAAADKLSKKEAEVKKETKTETEIAAQAIAQQVLPIDEEKDAAAIEKANVEAQQAEQKAKQQIQEQNKQKEIEDLKKKLLDDKNLSPENAANLKALIAKMEGGSAKEDVTYPTLQDLRSSLVTYKSVFEETESLATLVISLREKMNNLHTAAYTAIDQDFLKQELVSAKTKWDEAYKKQAELNSQVHAAKAELSTLIKAGTRPDFDETHLKTVALWTGTTVDKITAQSKQYKEALKACQSKLDLLRVTWNKEEERFTDLCKTLNILHFCAAYGRFPYNNPLFASYDKVYTAPSFAEPAKPKVDAVKL